jgi:regulator of RNase E activity RraA
LVGPAFTLRQAPKARSVSFDDNLARHPAAAKGAPPGSVIVIDVGGRTDIGSWGVNLSLIAQARGVAGLVIHGATRDAEDIRGLDFPVLCRGTTPLSSKWEMETVAMNEPVTIGHVVIRPGDIVCADGDGLIVLPAESCESIFDRSEEIERAEEKRRAAIRAGVLE